MTEEQPNPNQPHPDDTANQESQEISSGAIVPSAGQLPSELGDIFSVQIGKLAKNPTPGNLDTIERLVSIEEQRANTELRKQAFELNKQAINKQIELKEREIVIVEKKVSAEIKDLRSHFWLKTVAIAATTSFGIVVLLSFSVELGVGLFAYGMSAAFNKQNKNMPKSLDKFLSKPSEKKEDSQKNDK
jgi:hypothetical protein